MKTLQQIKGKRAESIALKHLKKAGLKLIHNNFYCKLGEIDLIMKDKKTIVFVEVRYRKSDHYGSSVESIDRRKQKRLARAAQFFIISKKWPQNMPYRFDIVGLSGDLITPSIQWIKNAF